VKDPNLVKALLIGVCYSFTISIVIYILGNLMFAEWVSFIFFLTISFVPSIFIFIIIRKLNTRRGNYILVVYSLLIGFLVSFLSLFISILLDKPFNEHIYWDVSTFEGFVWFLSFSIVGSFLFIPISYCFLRLNNRLTA
jgi:hypothetical protein